MSVGVVGATPRLDLDYDEDVVAAVDMNVVMSSEGRFVEVQGTGEHGTFDRARARRAARPRRRRDFASSTPRSARARAVTVLGRRLLVATRSAGKLRELRAAVRRRRRST